MFEREDMLKLTRLSMPFGKYKGSLLIDLPEAYLLWFSREGFPDGDLGKLMALALEMKIHGLTDIIRPLKTETDKEHT